MYYIEENTMANDTTTVELEAHELRKLRAAVGIQIDRHHQDGSNEVANEYRRVDETLAEAQE